MSHIDHRAVIEFFTPKDLTATEIHKELDNVYKDSVPSYCTVAKWGDEFKDPQCGFEDAPRRDCPSTTVTDENIQAIERIVMRDRQISVRRVVNQLAISKSSVLEIMNNYLDMSKVCTRWVPKLLIPIQHMNRVECYQELLQEIDANPIKFLDRIVTGDEFWICHHDSLSQQEAKF